MKIGICSWSLQPSDLDDLIEKVAEVGVGAVQLALDPVREGWGVERVRDAFKEADIELLSGMMMMEGEDYSTLEAIERTGGVRPDDTWGINRENAATNAAIASELGIDLVTLHAGFIPHEVEDPERQTMLARLGELIGIFAACDVKLALETGQENAETLELALEALGDADLGVNFDPANMILYGMGDPVDALARLSHKVAQIHIKDARGTRVPGEWGEEMVVGSGEVDWPEFAAAYRRGGLDCDLVIEREAGEARVADARRAVALVEEVFAS